MKQIQRVAVLLSIVIVWVKACNHCPEENVQPISSDDNYGQCTASDGIQCSGEKPKSFLTSHLTEDQCNDPIHAEPAMPIDSDETTTKSTETSIGDEATTDIHDEDKPKEDKVDESPEETICETYKKKFSQELLKGMNAPIGFVLHEFVDGLLNEYMDKVFDNALSDNSDDIKEVLWDLKDELEADIERKFAKAIEKRDKDNMFEWMFVQGQALSEDYKACCLKMFSKAGKALEKHGATIDLSKSLEL